MSGILVYSNSENLSLELLSAANFIHSNMGLPVKTLSINDEKQAMVLAAGGAESYLIKNDTINLSDNGALASAIKNAAAQLGTNIILLSSDRRGKGLAGRLAQKMGAGCLTDVGQIKVKAGEIECTRNTLGGSTLAVQVIKTENKIIAIEPKAFEKMAAGEAGNVKTLAVEAESTGIEIVEVRAKIKDSADIESASILVAIGQGLKSKDDLLMIEELVSAIGGEIACSKPVATDRKWLPEERIIGLSGKKCKPELAIVLGISGQVQFTVGIRNARIVAAVNTDENATIMQMADYSITGDLHNIVPEMIQALK